METTNPPSGHRKPGGPEAHIFFHARARVPAPGAAAADSAPAQKRGPAGWLAAHLRELSLVAVGVVTALAFVLLAQVVRPPAKPLSPRDVTRLVEKFLKEKKPDPSFASIAYAKVQPSLVLVRSMRRDPAGGEPAGGLGTGVVVEEETGLILTALHVVRDATDVRVVFHDGFETEATVVVAQPHNDLAVLKPAVIPDDLAAATLAGSGHLNVGDDVVAVGNPFGVVNSLSAGVVSGLGRSFQAPQTGETLSNLIQFDAAVNPGNSGGPLLDRNGEIVGIVSALLNPTEQEFFVGIGFAVTIEAASSALGMPPW
jgi:S1-C subfamily serine protease